MPDTNQRIRALAKETVRQIEELSAAHNAQKQAVYDNFHAQVEAIKAEATTKSLSGSGDGSLQTTDKQSKGIN
jgi:NurA-like 5'-3' nuclease